MNEATFWFAFANTAWPFLFVWGLCKIARPAGSYIRKILTL